MCVIQCKTLQNLSVTAIQINLSLLQTVIEKPLIDKIPTKTPVLSALVYFNTTTAPQPLIMTSQQNDQVHLLLG